MRLLYFRAKFAANCVWRVRVWQKAAGQKIENFLSLHNRLPHQHASNSRRVKEPYAGLNKALGTSAAHFTFLQQLKKFCNICNISASPRGRLLERNFGGQVRLQSLKRDRIIFVASQSLFRETAPPPCKPLRPAGREKTLSRSPRGRKHRKMLRRTKKDQVNVALRGLPVGQIFEPVSVTTVGEHFFTSAKCQNVFGYVLSV